LQIEHAIRCRLALYESVPEAYTSVTIEEGKGTLVLDEANHFRLTLTLNGLNPETASWAFIDLELLVEDLMEVGSRNTKQCS